MEVAGDRGQPHREACGASTTRKLSLDTLGFEPRAFRMRSGCDATTPCALEKEIELLLLLAELPMLGKGEGGKGAVIP